MDDPPFVSTGTGPPGRGRLDLSDEEVANSSVLPYLPGRLGALLKQSPDPGTQPNHRARAVSSGCPSVLDQAM